MSSIERTSPTSARTLRRYALPPEKLRAVVEKAIEDRPRWTVLVSHGGGLRAERRTRVFRFKDTITVRITDREDGSAASLESVSQTGAHDLGQNRRNLKELLEAIDHELR